MTKVLRVFFSDGSAWDIPTDGILRRRAEYYVDGDIERGECGADQREQEIETEIKSALKYDYEITQWADNNMDWKDVAEVAVRVPRYDRLVVDYDKEWTNAIKHIVEV